MKTRKYWFKSSNEYDPSDYNSWPKWKKAEAEAWYARLQEDMRIEAERRETQGQQ